MTGVILFNLYRGTYRHAITHVVTTIIGTVFLWVLCAANFEFAAYALLLLPVVFFVFLLAILFYDQSLLEVTRDYKPGLCQEECPKEEDTCSPCGK
jgi:Ca2+-dependent lipid-binding protein